MKIKFYLLYSLLFVCVVSFIILIFAYSSQKVEVDYNFRYPLKWDDFSSTWRNERLVNSKFYLGNVTFSTQGVFEKKVELPYLIACIKKEDNSFSESFYFDSISISFSSYGDSYFNNLDSFKTYPSYNQLVSVNSLNNVTLTMVAVYMPDSLNNEFYDDKISSIVIFELDRKVKSPFSFEAYNYQRKSCIDLSDGAKRIIEIPIF